MASITLNETAEKSAKVYAEQREVSLTEAANMLIMSGVKRLVAIHKYADKQKGAKPAKARKAKAPKSAKAPKVTKAKAPRVRKAKADPAPAEASVQ